MEDRIVTERGYQEWASWHVVYEWEDELARQFGYELCYMKNDLFQKILDRPWKLIPFRGKTKRWRLGFVMSPNNSHPFKRRNVIPIYLDVTESSIDKIIQDTRRLPCFFVTALDVCMLINNRNNDERCHYLSLSVADKYYTNQVPEKDIDVIQLGRKNEKLHEFMKQYCIIHPKVEYVYQTADATLTYESTTKGVLGKFETREKFMNMLSRSRVSLVSTPSYDNCRNFGSIDFFTPRFFESAANFCHMIGRYTENKECFIIGIPSVCVNAVDYKAFESAMDTYLSTDNTVNITKYDEFLKSNITTQRGINIASVLKANGFEK